MACAALEDKVKRAGDMGNPPILEFGFQVWWVRQQQYMVVYYYPQETELIIILI